MEEPSKAEVSKPFILDYEVPRVGLGFRLTVIAGRVYDRAVYLLVGATLAFFMSVFLLQVAYSLIAAMGYSGVNVRNPWAVCGAFIICFCGVLLVASRKPRRKKVEVCVQGEEARQLLGAFDPYDAEQYVEMRSVVELAGNELEQRTGKRAVLRAEYQGGKEIEFQGEWEGLVRMVLATVDPAANGVQRT